MKCHFLKLTPVLFILGASPVRAELPALGEKPWLGYFLGLKEENFQFGITSKGDAGFEPLKSNGETVSRINPVVVRFEILETTAGGEIVSKEIDKASITSTSPATADPTKPIVITGKGTGGATFEAAIIPERGAVSLTGRITDKSTLTNPKFAITLDFMPYHKLKKVKANEMEEFMKELKRDEIRAKPIAGGNAKLKFTDEGNPATLHKDGFSAIEIHTGGYDETVFELKASQDSKLIIEDKGDQPLYKGFSLRWIVNEGADPSKCKLTVTAD